MCVPCEIIRTLAARTHARAHLSVVLPVTRSYFNDRLNNPLPTCDFLYLQCNDIDIVIYKILKDYKERFVLNVFEYCNNVTRVFIYAVSKPSHSP